MNILKIIMNLVYPAKCIFCGKVSAFTKEELICRKCAEEIAFCKNFECCAICGKPRVSLGSRDICLECLSKTHRSYKRAVSAVKYNDATAYGIKKYKDGRSEISAKVFSSMLAERIKCEFGGVDFDFIVGVAPHRKNKRGGFSSVDTLCKQLSKETGIPYMKDALIKIKETPKQSSLNYEKRIKNLIGSIAVAKNKGVEGKRILLIDDVMTTGSTLEENSFVLKSDGAKAVYCATIATVAKEPKSYKNAEK